MRVLTTFDLSRMIRKHRRKLGMKRRALAEKAGVSRQWIVEIEEGKPRAEIGLLLRTLDALGLKLMVEDKASDRDGYDSGYAGGTGYGAGNSDGSGFGAGAWDVDIDAVIDAARAKKR